MYLYQLTQAVTQFTIFLQREMYVPHPLDLEIKSSVLKSITTNRSQEHIRYQASSKKRRKASRLEKADK